MKCPMCKNKLIKGEMKQYENLSEHVSDPNRTYRPLKQTYICKCEPDCYWDENGYIYITGGYESVVRISENCENTLAIDSIARKIDKEIFWHNFKRKFKIYCWYRKIMYKLFYSKKFNTI